MSEFAASCTVSEGGRFHTCQYGDRTGEIKKEKKTKPKVYRKYARAKAPVTVMLCYYCRARFCVGIAATAAAQGC